MLKAVLDTETLGLRTSSIILSIGVTVFDDSKVDSFEDLVNSGINIFIDRKIQEDAGRTFDQSTLQWWKDQGPEAQKALNQQGVSPAQAAILLEAYANSFPVPRKHLKWYCRGPQFDIAKIEDMFAMFETTSPWHYRKPRCSRTWLDEHGIDDNVKLERPAGMIPHNSLHDAAFEAYMMQRIGNGVDIPRVA